MAKKATAKQLAARKKFAAMVKGKSDKKQAKTPITNKSMKDEMAKKGKKKKM